MFPFEFLFDMHYVGTFQVTILDLDLTDIDATYRELDVKCYTFSNPTTGRLFEDFNIDVAWDMETGDFYVGSAVFV